MRATRKEQERNPWNKTSRRKNDLLTKPAEAEQKQDFYSRLYKQYTMDLLRLGRCSPAAAGSLVCANSDNASAGTAATAPSPGPSCGTA